LRILSPVHVGCDEVYEPTTFTIDEEKGSLIVFEPLEFLKSLGAQEKRQFSEICGKGTIGSILELYKFLRNRRPPGKTVDVCPGLVEHYKKTLGLPIHDQRKLREELNNFSIARTSFNPNTDRPFIPGSAIKGALRTAYLNGRASLRKMPSSSGRGSAKELEKTLLDGGSFATDPFRMLKISDFQPVGPVRTRIVYAVNRTKEPGRFEARGLHQILEVIEPDTLLEGWISVDRPHEKSGIKNPLTADTLMRNAEAFFGGEMGRESQCLAALGATTLKAEKLENAFLLRLGRHSGAECVTVEGHRNIRIMQGKGEKTDPKIMQPQSGLRPIQADPVPMPVPCLSDGCSSIQSAKK
jgi:CRISPR-associated protein Csm5